jgi:hypothetical protein
MTYTAPKLTELGSATALILFGGVYKNPGGNPDCAMNTAGGLCPAYEVDD